MPARIRKGDRVVVISGRDKGRSGEVLGVMPKQSRAIVQGINMVRRHQRQSASQEGGIINKEMSIHLSNLAHIDPKEDKPTRIRIERKEDGSVARVAKRSGESIDG